MSYFIIQTKDDISENIDRMHKAQERQAFIKVYTKELTDFDNDIKTYLFIYSPLIAPLYWITFPSAGIAAFFWGFNKGFWVMFGISAILWFFRSKYFVMFILLFRLKRYKLTIL